MSPPLPRPDALRVLDLAPGADLRDVKRAYRRLARAHHPDTGGDPATFHELQRAYESLLSGDGRPAAPLRGRPSRDRRAWSADVHRTRPEVVDLDRVDWATPVPTGEVPLDHHRLAVWLAEPGQAPVHPVTASSRSPGSRLNRVGHLLASDLTSHLSVRGAVDDRGREVVQVEVRGANRRARRALDAVGLDGGWVRARGSSTTTLRRSVTPEVDRRATAVRTLDAVEDLLDRLGWPLPAWRLTVTDPTEAAGR